MPTRTLFDNGVLLGAGAAAPIKSTVAMTDNQILVGHTGGPPTPGAVTDLPDIATMQAQIAALTARVDNVVGVCPPSSTNYVVRAKVNGVEEVYNTITVTCVSGKDLFLWVFAYGTNNARATLLGLRVGGLAGTAIALGNESVAGVRCATGATWVISTPGSYDIVATHTGNIGDNCEAVLSVVAFQPV